MEINRDIIQNFISRLCFFVSIFLINILISQLLGASGSGKLYYAINNFSIITLLVSFSLEAGMTYFLARKEIDDSELVFKTE